MATPSRIAFRALLAVTLSYLVAAFGDHPIVKVIDLLHKLEDEVIEEGKAEEVTFEKFKYWCSTSKATLEKAIEEEKATIDTLESKIEGLKKSKEELEEQIKKLEEDIKDLEEQAKAAKEADEKRTKAYTEAKADLEATIKAVGEALEAMEGASKTDSTMLQMKAQASVRQALALLSLKTTDEQRNTLVAFAGAEPERPEQLAAGDEKAHVERYKFKSTNVIDLLKELKLKFEDDLTKADTEETNGANEYKLEKQARDAALKAAEKSKTQKEEMLSETESSLAEAEGDLKDEKADLKADTETLETTDTTCKTRTEEWDVRSKTRENEVEAIKAAIKILGKVSGVRTEAPSNPVLPTSPLDFLQIADPKTKAIQLIRAAAQSTHSKALERLATQISALSGKHFEKVIDMIQKMIFRLMAEQTDEDKHKAWCDLELEKTEKTETEKEEKIKDLEAKITEADAKVAKLDSEIREADAMVASIIAFQAEATEVREAGKKENAIAIKEAVQAQEAIAKAVAVLETHYKESGEIPKEPWEFLQDPVTLPESPKLWESSYTGVADPTKEGTGVVAILEKIATDYSKMEAETKAQEAEDQKEYEDVMKEHDVEKKRRRTESEAKVQEKKRKLDKVAAMTTQKKHTRDELEAAKAYMKELQPSCVEGDSTFEERKAARSKEIDALKEAQVLLQEAFKDVKKSSFLAINKHGSLA